MTDKKPAKIILDTDMLTDCDDAAAVAMLHALADDGEAEILGMAVSSGYGASAAVVNAINTYYGRPEIAIGAPKNGSGVYLDTSCFLDDVSKNFPHPLKSNGDAPDAVKVYRKILASDENASIKIVTIGYMSNIENLLKSPPDEISPLNGKELIAGKVSEWVCMGGNFPVDPAKDNVNFTRDPHAAVYSIKNFPVSVKITFVGREIGHNIHVGEALKNTPPQNPVRRAYELHRGRAALGHWNHHTADPSAILYAVRRLGDYFDISPAGFMDLNDDCSFVWKSGEGSLNQSYVIQKMDRDKMGRIMEELFTRVPKS